MLRPKMTAFVLQSVTPVGEEKIKERCRAINEDDIIGMVKLIITCHTSTGKASTKHLFVHSLTHCSILYSYIQRCTLSTISVIDADSAC